MENVKATRLHRLAISAVFALIAPSVMVAQEVRSLPAITVAERIAEISAPRGGILNVLNAQLGQSVAQGELLASLDCPVETAQISAAQAQLALATLEVTVQRRRAAGGAGGAASVRRAEGQEELAIAELATAQAQESLCEITAPFDGIVVDVPARAHETIVAGELLVTMIDPGAVRLNLVLPADWLLWVEPGTEFTFRPSADSNVYRAQITVLSARVEPVSQTVQAQAAFLDEDTLPIAGGSGIAEF